MRLQIGHRQLFELGTRVVTRGDYEAGRMDPSSASRVERVGGEALVAIVLLLERVYFGFACIAEAAIDSSDPIGI
jgi:hypothetical protein